MDFSLTEEQLAIRKTAREFALKEIAPTADADDKAHRFRRDIVKKMADLGFFGCVIPEEYGGIDIGFLAQTLITEEIARVHSSMRLPFNMQTMGPALTIVRWGTEEQKRKYVPGLVAADILGCFAITEPDTGSDVASLKTTAARAGDGYVLNGTKTWISNAQVADVGLVYACTDPSQKAKGMSAFVVDMKSPGVTTRPITEKLGTWAAPTGEVIFEDCGVPADALLGKEGEGFKICMSMLDNTRLSCASGALGVAKACLDAAVTYANERRQFGQPIGQFQMIQDMIAQMAIEAEAARLLLYRAAWQKDRGLRNTLETSMAKYYCAEAANKAADFAVKILSSYGYSEEYPVARYYRDAKSYQIVEGTSVIQKVIVALDTLGYRKANR
ncbi:MAG: acyl-CoA dehydrogenase family protein [Actinobacteria bacterium]|nr:acyl-CoA dehydrogenase family protein [Actinomycetota bacterium]